MSCTLNSVVVWKRSHVRIFFFYLFACVRWYMFTATVERTKIARIQEKNWLCVLFSPKCYHCLSEKIPFMCWFSHALGINNSVMFYSDSDMFPLILHKILQTDFSRCFCFFFVRHSKLQHNDDLVQKVQIENAFGKSTSRDTIAMPLHSILKWNKK